MEMNRLRILVIDEVSMVDPDLLAEVESVCRLYVDDSSFFKKGPEGVRLFGGVIVVFVGDFVQLPPVRSKVPACRSVLVLRTLIRVPIHLCIPTYVHLPIRVTAPVHIPAYANTHMYTHMHTPTHTQVCAHTRSRMCACAHPSAVAGTIHSNTCQSCELLALLAGNLNLQLTIQSHKTSRFCSPQKKFPTSTA